MLIKSILTPYYAGVARMLESEEAARRLGVKLSTLYAYVSRGQLRLVPERRQPSSAFRRGRGRRAGTTLPRGTARGNEAGFGHDRDHADP